MVINKEMKRKRKEECPSPLLDESPKRTKVHAQRKFAQGSNVNSPVITPVKEIEKQEIDVLSEPVELLPIKRPNTEDFLTFLCFRGTPVLPPSLNFFNTASIVDTNGQVHEIKSESPKNGPIDTSSISKSGSGSSDRPFVAFGVRKRADPIVISRQMDKKRRHALALQALRRKYQEQKMAKIRAVAISKLSEKVTSKTLVRSCSVTKQEPVKKSAPIQKGKVTVEEKEVKVETRSMAAGLRPKIKQKMCLRSFRGRFVQKELQFRNVKKRNLAVKKVEKDKGEKEEVKSEISEYSSDDEEPLAKTSTEKRASPKVILPKIAKKSAPGPKKPIEIKITRSNKFLHNKIVSRRQQIKQRMILTTPKTIVKPRTLRSQTAQKPRILPETKQTILIKSKSLIQAKEVTKKQQLPIIKKTVKTPNTKSEKKESVKKEEPAMSKKETRLSEIMKKAPKSVESGKGEVLSPVLTTKKNDKPTVKKEAGNTKKIKVECKQTPQFTKTQIVKETEKSQKKLPVPSKKAVEKKEQTKKEGVKQEENKKPTKQEEKKTTKQEESKKLSKQEESKKLSKQEESKKLSKQEESKKLSKQEETKKSTKLEETKKLVTKTEQKESAESKNCQRPTRKTKEAAAIYMEILSHKLVNEGKIDDDNVSIDSFPELPNVKKTEQRENELKAKAKTKPEDLKVKKEEISEHKVLRSAEKRKLTNKPAEADEKKKEVESEDKPKKVEEKKCVKEEIVKEEICDRKTRSQQDKTIVAEKNEEKGSEDIKKVTTIRKKGYDLIIEEFNSASEEEEIKEDKKEESPKRQTRNSTQNIRHTESDDSDESFRADIKIPRKKQITRSKISKNCDSDESVKKSLRTSARSYKESSDSDQSTTSDINLSQMQTQKKNKKFTKTRQIKDEQSFSDSDEEPLSKLTQNKKKETKEESRKPLKEKSADEEKQVKPKRECAKRPQNYLPMFSSSDEEDEFFHGFSIETAKPKPKIQENLCLHPQTSDLSCKDIGRRFGKGKVNMSTEQIEKWLKDSAMAGSSVKSEDDSGLNFGENIPTETWFSVANSIDTDKLKSVLIVQSEKQDDKKEAKVSEAESPSPSRPSSATKSTDRKLIFRNKDKGVVSNVKAFSVSNENSVYAFEESEDTMKTPFRRPTRRPSSTATSRSEDEAKVEDLPKMQFRKPPLVRQDSLKSKEEDDSAFYIPSTLIKSKSFPSTSKIEKKLGMIPPKVTKSTQKKSEAIDEKYKVPSSPSASSSSSAKLYKRQIKFRATEILPVKVSDFPIGGAQLVEAPTFHPTEKEFQDPLEYIEKIRAKAEQFGICRIVPPSTFKPECKVTDDMRFTAYNQYVHKMLHRWGPNFKELMAIKKYLSTQNINLTHPPWIGGMEVDLPRLYQTVQSLGGLKEVIEKKKWPKVSDAMKIPKSAQDRVTKLDDIYCKYLLPYDTLSPAEREKLFDEVETEWAKRESKSLLKAQQSVETNESDEEETDDEAEECIVKGRSMALNAFYRIARNTMSMWFKTSEPPPEEVEQEFWKHVTLKQNHICVHSGSIDSGNWGYGFAVSKNSPFARHAWNLKVLTNNSGSVLRSLGPIMGVTVPTLHVGMVFSSCCWYRDPHSLPWIEYLHTGGSKIWYAIPNSTSGAFQAALKTIVPNYCRNKSLWLPSDTVMVPPNLLVEHGVALSRIVQEPGQFIVVFPKVFTSSLSTGYVVSESVYFAPPYWLKSGRVVFDELRNSCEPSMFSFDRLLLSILNDVRSNVEVLKQIIPAVQQLCDKEKSARAKIRSLGVNNTEKLPPPEAPQRKKRKLQNEDGEYECEICRMNLFVSMVTESQEDLVLCLEHAIEQIETKKIQSKHCTLAYTYDDDELNGLIEKIKEAIANKLQKKVPGRFAGMPTLLTK